MDHPFFVNIDWNLLRQKKPTGNFWPDKPKCTIEDYQIAFPTTELNDEEIDQIYNGDEYEDDSEENPFFGHVQDWEFDADVITGKNKNGIDFNKSDPNLE